MTNKKLKLIRLFFCFLFLLIANYGLLITTSHAQQITLSISPPIIETVIKPGKEILIAYDLKNHGDPTVISAKVLPFSPKDNYGNILIKSEFEGPIRFSLDNSIIQLEEPFFLKSGAGQQLLLRIRIPEGAPEGDYYYVLLAETQPKTDLGGGVASTARATIGANIIITVTNSGNLDNKGRISFFDTLARLKFSVFGKTIRLFDSSDKIPVVLTINNYGRNIIKPYGQIIMKGNFGEKARYDLLPQNVLAGSQRLITATPSAKIKSKTPISLVIPGFFIGKYSLSANLGFTEEGGPTQLSTISFFAFPFKISLAIFSAIFITVFIIKKNSQNTEIDS